MYASDQVVKWPFGEADVQSIAYADISDDIVIKNNKTIVTVGTLEDDVTVNLDISDEVEVGAELTLRLTSDTTARDVTLGTGLEGNAIAGVISKTKVAKFEFDGSNFVCVSTIQID